jgi:hypothetical protein
MLVGTVIFSMELSGALENGEVLSLEDALVCVFHIYFLIMIDDC